ncbi:hypothetical protein HDU76_008213 [Blyttiomyces sp. JEL0837]|nr:hypothetical protein HDU76_008213 [Blyttiomyces sp. JEL0837]
MSRSTFFQSTNNETTSRFTFFESLEQHQYLHPDRPQHEMNAMSSPKNLNFISSNITHPVHICEPPHILTPTDIYHIFESKPTKLGQYILSCCTSTTNPNLTTEGTVRYSISPSTQQSNREISIVKELHSTLLHDGLFATVSKWGYHPPTSPVVKCLTGPHVIFDVLPGLVKIGVAGLDVGKIGDGDGEEGRVRMFEFGMVEFGLWATDGVVDPELDALFEWVRRSCLPARDVSEIGVGIHRGDHCMSESHVGVGGGSNGRHQEDEDEEEQVVEMVQTMSVSPSRPLTGPLAAGGTLNYFHIGGGGGGVGNGITTSLEEQKDWFERGAKKRRAF